MLFACLVSGLSIAKTVVAIDAGHGGKDPGAIGSTLGIKEKTVTLAIAKELKALLDADPNFKAVMTRSGDYFIQLPERTEIARKHKANYLVSIHADSSPTSSSMKGASVWVLSNRRASDEMGKWLEESEKQSELLGGAGRILSNNNEKYFNQTVLDLQFSHAQRSGYELGKTVLSRLSPFVSLAKSSPQHASLSVLRSPDITSILVETGFLSNPAEEQKLVSPTYRKMIAKSIYYGLVAYRNRHLGISNPKGVNVLDTEKAEKSEKADKKEQAKEKSSEKETSKDKKNNENLILKYDDIAKIISDWSKIPVNRLTAKESQKYLSLSDNLKNIVIGQGTAIDRVTNAIKRSRAGVSLGSKPIGSFIFVGATGVGKTYLAKSLANLLFESEENMIRIDMSEYMEKHTVSKLVGSPPGYVGYGEGGYLTEAVRRKPYSVVLFDEIEKAHPDVFNMLLQILDDGRLTDSQGKTVNFKNTVIIMTSNVGASAIEKKNSLGFSAKKNEEEKEYDRMKEIVNSELKIMFKPEFLNRVDDIIVFSKLDEKDILKITELLLEKLKKRLKNMGLNIGYSNKIVKKLSDMGFDKAYGARPLERIIKSELENKIADEILKNQILNDEKLFLDVKKGNIVLEKVKVKTK